MQELGFTTRRFSTDSLWGWRAQEKINARFRFAPGQQTGMEAVLEDDLVEFDDGTPATTDQMARDVTEFLAWAADPHREIRHSIGSRVVVFLFLLTMMLIALKREVWAHLHEKKPAPEPARPADPEPTQT